MIQRLRKKFTLLSMAAFFVVLAVIVSCINVVNYIQTVNQADELLDILSDNKGVFPPPVKEKAPLPKHISPETPYETRYFSVVINQASGDVVEVEMSRIISVDRDTAISYAEKVDGTRGFLKNYRYAVRDDGANRRIIFLDCSRMLSSFRSFLLISALSSLAGLAVVFLLIALLSRRVVRPICESYEKQKEFITNAGHEIKTPLTIIGADIDVLTMDGGENEWLEDIRLQTKRLSELTQDLIFLSRMEEENHALQKIDFPFSDMVSEGAESFRSAAQVGRKDLVCDIEPMLTLNGDEKSLRQLVSILLDNALKYAPENTTIRLTLKKQSGSAVLSVSNPTEQALDKETLSRLFERFYRADPSRSEKSGYGIGLSIAKAIVTAHGGKLRAAADGTTLTISATLPLQ